MNDIRLIVPSAVGTAATVNFADNLTVTFGAGIATVVGSANTAVTFTDKLSVGDSPELIAVGVGSDLRMFHESGNSVIQNNTGALFVKGGEIKLRNTGDTADYIEAKDGSYVRLYHDQANNAVPKLETSATGVSVTGIVSATSYTGSGANLTGIEAGIQTSVPKSVSGITTVLDLSKDDFKITAAGITTIDVRGGSEGNSHTLRIHNSGITTVGFSTYFLFPSGAAPIIPTTDGTISLISFTVDRQGAVGLATQLLAGSSVNFS